MEEGQKYNIVYSGDEKLANCGFMTEATFKSGTTGFKMSLPIAEVRKAITMSKSKDWVNLMAFKAKENGTKTSEERKSVANYKQTRKSFEDDKANPWDDE